MRSKVQEWFALLTLTLWPAAVLAQPVLFVDVSRVTGANDGSSWQDAFQGSLGLQAALAGAPPGSGMQIWIAQGRYTPAAPGGSRSVSFVPKPGVLLYGGFAGTETDFSQRDPQAHVTLLSGDLNNNDLPNGNNTNDNSLHVIHAMNVDATAVLDGLTIRDGAASGVSNLDRTGANLLIEGGAPTIRNCVITLGNAGVTGGGAALMAASSTFENCRFTSNQSHSGCGGLASLNGGSPTISGCRFESNFCGFGGAGILCAPFIVNGIVGGRAVIQNCDFLNNTGNSGIGMMLDRCPANIKRCRFYNNSGNGGGGMYIINSPSVIVSCDFVGNQAPGDGGGAVFASGSTGPLATPLFANCRFIGNNGVFNINGGSAIAINCTMANNTLSPPPFQGWPVVHCGGQMALRNCLIWGNGPTGPGLGGVLSGLGITADLCDVQSWDGSIPGAGSFSANPQFVSPNGADGQPGTADDDVHLLAASPCVDAANNALLPVDSADLDGDGDLAEPLPLEFDGHPRIMKCRLDIGAYEFVAGAPASGDMNADGVTDTADIAPFAAALLGGAADCIADTNGDTVIDGEDVAGFVRRFLMS